MKTRNNLVIILNVIVSILFIIPSFKLDLFAENYSTLSLTTRGYLYVLFLGIIIGILLAYETYKITNNKIKSFIIFLSLFIGCVVPHHVPYNLQGNLHLLFAYLGFVGLVVITYLNVLHTKLMNIFVLLICLVISIYLKYSIVNTLSEIIVMLTCLYVNAYKYIQC